MSPIQIFFLFFVSSALAAKKPGFIDFNGFVCPREPNALSKCLKNTLNTYIPSLAKGVPLYGVPPCEPLLVPEVTLQQKRGPVVITSTYNEVTIRGPSAMKIRDITIDSANKEVTAQLYIPSLKIKGKYKVSGKVLMLPIEGEGLFSGNYGDIDAELVIKLGRESRGRGKKDALTCEDLGITFNIGSAKVQMDNLFGGDEALGGTMNKFLNENWERVGTELQPSVEKSLLVFLKPLADHAFSTLDADDILGEEEDYSD